MTQLRTLPGLVTLGAAAVATGLPAEQATAQTADGVSVTVDGGLAFNGFSEDFFEDKLGAPPGGFDFGRDTGFFGSVAVSGRISDTWDWRVSGSALSFSENTVSFISDDDDDDDDGEVSNRLRATTIGIDAGYNLSTGPTDVRLGFGVMHGRYAQTYGIRNSKGFGFSTDIDYRGTGLSLSADVAHPVSADGRTKLIGGASIAATNGEYTVGGPLGDDDDDDIDGDAMISAAYLGIAFQRSETVQLRGGLRVDHFDGDSDEVSDEFGLINGDVTTTSLFVGMKVDF